jgi:hypothetical protein
MLKQVISDDDLTLLEIWEDPIWLGEFLRSTGDGETKKDLQPQKEWNYRDYQRQVLSDKSEFILMTGGRAIGKCQPLYSRVYTTQGYKKISELQKLDSFGVYSLTTDLKVVQKRARVSYDRDSPVYKLITEDYKEIDATGLHPILTPSGYKILDLIEVGDYVAVATKLPHDSTQNLLSWDELRLLGYYYLNTEFHTTNYMQFRFKKILREVAAIAQRYGTRLEFDEDGKARIRRLKNGNPHIFTLTMEDLGIVNKKRNVRRRIPELLMNERLENIRVFFGAAFAQHFDISAEQFSFTFPYKPFLEDLQELLLRFGIETYIDGETLRSLDYRAVYRALHEFDIAGVKATNMRVPDNTEDVNESMKYVKVVAKLDLGYKATFAIYVYDTNNYISENVYVHNSVLLEDRAVYNMVNADIQFPVTREALVTTPNKAQMTPLISKLILRMTSGKILKDFLKNKVNKSDGTMRFPVWGRELIYHYRIAGSKGENNMVGLHIPDIIGDEMQLFGLDPWTQLQPAYNQWEERKQQFIAGVPNGLRNSVLYQVDTRSPKFKKYRIPSHMNPYYTREDDIQNIRNYGGEEDDRYQQMVLGRHGEAAFQIIPRDSIQVETYRFYKYIYDSTKKNHGDFRNTLDTPPIPNNGLTTLLAIDPGFVDPTIINVMVRDNTGVWRTYVRYQLLRVDFKEQADIIDWIATAYSADRIAIDVGAGGNGASLIHNLTFGDSYRGKNYDKRLHAVQFAQQIVTGYDENGTEYKESNKSHSAAELAKIIQDGNLVFSEIDQEAISQLERVARQKSINGQDKYYVLTPKGVGVSKDDHIFAAYICFMDAIRYVVESPHKFKRLGRTIGKYT